MGKEREQMELLKNNIIQWHVASVGSLGTFFPEIATFDIPFAFSSQAQAYAVCDGWYGREIGEAIANKISGVVLVGICEAGGFYALSNNVRPVRTPADLKGVKIRTMTVPGQMRMVESWGAAATPMPWAELYTGLQTGVVQGQQNPVPIIVHGKLYEVQKHVTLLDHLWGTDWVLMNKAWLKTLPEHYRNIVFEAIRTSIVAGRGVNRLVEATDRGVAFLQEKGIQVYSPTPEEREQFKTLAQPAVIDYIKETLGDDGMKWVDKLLKAAKEAEETVHMLPPQY
jgi:tripartite ATP-independent transporter DctP family solute receptor